MSLRKRLNQASEDVHELGERICFWSLNFWLALCGEKMPLWLNNFNILRLFNLKFQIKALLNFKSLLCLAGQFYAVYLIRIHFLKSVDGFSQYSLKLIIFWKKNYYKIMKIRLSGREKGVQNPRLFGIVACWKRKKKGVQQLFLVGVQKIH